MERGSSNSFILGMSCYRKTKRGVDGMTDNKEWCVTKCLPDDGEKVLCFGHETYCCSEDMEDQPEWHEVTFRFMISMYKLKSQIPADPEETILEKYEIREVWEMGCDPGDGHVIGVTKWKDL